MMREKTTDMMNPMTACMPNITPGRVMNLIIPSAWAMAEDGMPFASSFANSA